MQKRTVSATSTNGSNLIVAKNVRNRISKFDADRYPTFIAYDRPYGIMVNPVVGLTGGAKKLDGYAVAKMCDLNPDGKYTVHQVVNNTLGLFGLNPASPEALAARLVESEIGLTIGSKVSFKTAIAMFGLEDEFEVEQLKAATLSWLAQPLGLGSTDRAYAKLFRLWEAKLAASESFGFNVIVGYYATNPTFNTEVEVVAQIYAYAGGKFVPTGIWVSKIVDGYTFLPITQGNQVGRNIQRALQNDCSLSSEELVFDADVLAEASYNGGKNLFTRIWTARIVSFHGNNAAHIESMRKAGELANESDGIVFRVLSDIRMGTFPSTSRTPSVDAEADADNLGNVTPPIANADAKKGASSGRDTREMAMAGTDGGSKGVI